MSRPTSTEPRMSDLAWCARTPGLPDATESPLLARRRRRRAMPPAPTSPRPSPVEHRPGRAGRCGPARRPTPGHVEIGSSRRSQPGEPLDGALRVDRGHLRGSAALRWRWRRDRAVEHLLEALEQRAELEEVEQPLQLAEIVRPHDERGDVRGRRRSGRRAAAPSPRRSCAPGPRVAARLSRSFGRQLVEVGEDAVESRRRWRSAWPPSSPPRRARPAGCRTGRRAARRTPGTASASRRCARRCRPRRRARSRTRRAGCRAP